MASDDLEDSRSFHRLGRDVSHLAGQGTDLILHPKGNDFSLKRVADPDDRLQHLRWRFSMPYSGIALEESQGNFIFATMALKRGSSRSGSNSGTDARATHQRACSS